jgi:RNA polymerase sigma factor (sigma-70 family)
VDELGPGELVRAAAAGDASAWNGLVDRFGRLVWAVTRSFGLNEADGADVSQTAWLRLVENLDRLTDPDRVGAWLATTARRECLHILRRAGRTMPTDSLDELDSPSDQSVDRAILARVEGDAVWRALETIPLRCQTLLRLLVAEPPISYEDISAALDMPVGSIGPTRGRCLDRLRKAAANLGIRSPTDGSSG